METATRMEELDDPQKFCEWLKDHKFSDAVVTAFADEEITGLAFLDLTEQDLEDMKLKKGPIKNLLRIQQNYRSNETQVCITACT